MIRVRRILVSQPQPDPEKSPYADIIKKYNVKIDFFKFFKIVGISSKEFRKQKVNLGDCTSVVFTSKNAVDHFFRIAGELRVNISENLKYFCTTEAIALYLQKYVIYRKRKVFFCNQETGEIIDLIKKHKTEKFILPCTEGFKTDIPICLEKEKIDCSKAILYKTVSEDLSKVDLMNYDMFAFFSPSGIKSLFENFADFKQGEKIIAVFGNTTLEEARKKGINPQIIAPSKSCPSMIMAIDAFLDENFKAKKKQITPPVDEPVILKKKDKVKKK